MRDYYGNTILDFAYDANGQPYSMHYNSTPYFYILNLQGDVIRMVDGNGNTVASYEYDPYGKVISATGSMADINPLRYRGYYYDQETQLYHLWSRYYDPQTGRFINADDMSYLGADCTPLSYNLYAYCLNNPVNRTDEGGNLSLPNWAKIAVGATVIAGLAVATICTGGVVGVIAGAALTGAVSGGIGGAISGAVTGAISGGLQGALDGASSGFMSGTLIGGASGAITSGLSIATGAVNVIGSAQKTGTLLHRAASNIEAGKMTAQAWKYSQVTLNRSLKTAGLTGRKMPDVIGIARNGTSVLVEVVSKSQTVAQMTAKCISMANANPGATYKVIGWAATVSRLLQ